MAHPFISVVIPTHNRRELLGRTLASVLAQSYGDFETIVVDDGSSDGTGAYLAEFGDRIRIVAQRNLGPGAARNSGLRCARGAYVAFLDSDDLWFPWTLETFSTVIERHREPSIVLGSIVEFTEEATMQEVRRDPLEVSAFPDYLVAARQGLYAGSGAAILKSDAVRRAGGFVEQRANAEDHDLTLRLGTSPGFVVIRSPRTLGWRRHAGGLTQDIAKSVSGVQHLVLREKAAAYPGGPGRLAERIEAITLHARAASVAALNGRTIRGAVRLYLTTLCWNLRLGRWRYLAGFPLLAGRATFRSLLGPRVRRRLSA